MGFVLQFLKLSCGVLEHEFFVDDKFFVEKPKVVPPPVGCNISLHCVLIKWALPVISAQLLPSTLFLRLGDGPGSRSLLN